MLIYRSRTCDDLPTSISDALPLRKRRLVGAFKLTPGPDDNCSAVLLGLEVSNSPHSISPPHKSSCVLTKSNKEVKPSLRGASSLTTRNAPN